MKSFDSYQSALAVLTTARQQDLENTFVCSGVVNKFNLQLRLCIELLSGLLRYEGDVTAVTGSPREILKAAYQYFDFIDQDIWLSMLRDRNNIMHVYDEGAMQALLRRILDDYIPAFEALRHAVEDRYGSELEVIA